MKVVREGQSRRAPIERVVDIITGYFVPVVTLLAISTWVIWLGLGLGGALPADYLDIEVGGWGKCNILFSKEAFRSHIAQPSGLSSSLSPSSSSRVRAGSVSPRQPLFSSGQGWPPSSAFSRAAVARRSRKPRSLT